MNTAPATPPEKSLSQPPASPVQPPAPADGGSMLRWVMTALAIWGMLLALGRCLVSTFGCRGHYAALPTAARIVGAGLRGGLPGWLAVASDPPAPHTRLIGGGNSRRTPQGPVILAHPYHSLCVFAPWREKRQPCSREGASAKRIWRCRSELRLWEPGSSRRLPQGLLQCSQLA